MSKQGQAETSEQIGLSWFENLVKKGAFAPSTAAISSVLGIVLAVIEYPVVAVFVGVPGVCLAGVSVVLRWHIRQSSARFDHALREERYRTSEAFRHMHTLIHTARDGAATCVSYLDRLAGEDVISDLNLYFESGAKQRDLVLQRMVQSVLDLFKGFLGDDTPVWIELRQIRTDSQYHTLMNVGAYASERDHTPRPIGQNEGLPRYLREQQKLNRGIVIFNDYPRPVSNWKATEHDDFKDDCSTMAGPVHVLTSSGTEDIPIREMVMILRISSSVPGVFQEREHVEPMKGCVDAFSMFLGAINDAVIDIR